MSRALTARARQARPWHQDLFGGEELSDPPPVRRVDSRGYSAFEDVLSGHWEHPDELAPPGLEGTQSCKPGTRSRKLGRYATCRSVDSRRSVSSRGGSRPGTGIGSRPGTGSAAVGSWAVGPGVVPAATVAVTASPSVVGRELRSMLKGLNVEIGSIGTSEGMQAMLALATPEEQAIRSFDRVAEGGERDQEQEEEEEIHVEASQIFENPSSRPGSPLQPGVYASLASRDRVIQAEVRGLPNRGRDMLVTQQTPRLPRPPMSRERDLNLLGRRPESSGVPGKVGDAPAAPRKPVTNKILAASRRRPPHSRSVDVRAQSAEYDEHLREERRQYAAWKRKVIDCARRLDLEANRFRMEKS